MTGSGVFARVRALLASACGIGMLLGATGMQAEAAEPQRLMVWAGAATGAPGSTPANAVAVIDADPASATYGRLVASALTDKPSSRVHHTEYVMPARGVLFANDHDIGRTYRIDLRDPDRPRVLGVFEGLGGLEMPHSFVRTSDRTVLATFMHASGGHHTHGGHGAASPWITGGLAEIDDDGRLIRSAFNADPAFEGELLSPYGLIVLPEIDRVLSTNSAMQRDHGPGSTYQVWRLSDLKLLSTHRFDPGPTGLDHVDPEEPRLGPDGSVYVQTLSCGLQRVMGLAENRPRAEAVWRFPGGGCGVPTIVGSWLIQSVPYLNGLVVLDVSDPKRIREAARLSLPDGFRAHWTGWDPKGGRIVVTGSSRVYLLDLDRKTGRLMLDERFAGADGAPGFDFTGADWPDHAKGRYVPHGAVFTR